MYEKLIKSFNDLSLPELIAIRQYGFNRLLPVLTVNRHVHLNAKAWIALSGYQKDDDHPATPILNALNIAVTHLNERDVDDPMRFVEYIEQYLPEDIVTKFTNMVTLNYASKKLTDVEMMSKMAIQISELIITKLKEEFVVEK